MQALSFGERLALIRKRRKMTQKRLSDAIGCQQSEMHRLEGSLVLPPHCSRRLA